MSDTPEQTGTLATALAQAAKLLGPRPDLAAEQAREILKAAPGHAQALFILAAALRAQGDAAQAREILERLANAVPNSADIHCELGLALSDLGDSKGAIAMLTRATRINGKHAQAWRALGDEKTLAGDTDGADDAYAHHIEASVNDPKLLEAAVALRENKIPVAERILRDFLKLHPTDVTAMRMLAEIAARLRRYDDAEKLLARALELAPGFTAARQNLASIYYRHNKPEEALEHVQILLKEDGRNPAIRALKAAILAQLGEYEQTSAIYEKLLRDVPVFPSAWMSYGHALKTLGKTGEGIAAYRRSIAQQPSLGEAYWSLANLKTFRFSAEDMAAMQNQIAREDLKTEDRFHLEFAMGKALEDEGRFAESFEHYAKGNALRRETAPYYPQNIDEQVRRAKSFFTSDRLATGDGHPAPDPIFVIGLPRAGSTLIEQILSSHSQVEGTKELHDIGQIARGIGGIGKWARDSAYPEILADQSPEQLKALGEDYLSRTRIHRKSDRPFFVDKMPNNFLYAGFIRMILPNAKIIDARRHPLGCCLSCFKQHFARGQTFAYDLGDLGHYYAKYVELMAHFDAVMPGGVHRVLYEDMVADPEREVRRLLDHCGLPFEAACLQFHQNDRAVRTASSEQVRQPIFRDAVEHWQNFEPWLGPLKESLGPVLPAYPGAPVF